MKDYPQIIRERLEKLGKSQAWLAEQVNTSRQNLNHHLQSNSLPSHLLDKIQDVLGINLYDIKKKSSGETAEVQESEVEYNRVVRIEFTPEEIREMAMQKDTRYENLRQEIQRIKESLATHGIVV